MPKPPDKLQLLNDMKLNAYELELAVKECDWRPCQARINALLNNIKTLETIFANSPLPEGYAEKCTCLNCLPTQEASANDSDFWKRWRT